MEALVSIWERQSFLEKVDVIIVGGGIVGLNAAISMKELAPHTSIMIVERGSIPLGASTRNAGFACFGSVTELWSDLQENDDEKVFQLVENRWQGLEFLRQRVGDEPLDYKSVGGYEVFNLSQNASSFIDKIDYLNKRIEEVTKLKDTFQLRSMDLGFRGFAREGIYNQYEGSLHPGKMMESLYKKAHASNIKILMGEDIRSIDEGSDGVIVHTRSHQLQAHKILLCTNGFSKTLYPDLPLQPARNQVIVTEEIANLRVNSCFHFDQGFTYFRNIGKRLLVGGGRNYDLDKEATSYFGKTEKIQDYLKEVLFDKIGIDRSIKVEYSWSGIMGVGKVKEPILKKHTDNIIFAIRLGGMGVALGAKLGHEAAKLVLR